jgi:hypothetical protein
MLSINRRQHIAGLSAVALGAGSGSLWTQAAMPGKDKPANPGGGWSMRSIAKTGAARAVRRAWR